MIADTRVSVSERIFAVLTVPLWGPVWGIYHLIRAYRERPPKPLVGEVLEPILTEPWRPATDLERAVYAALILAGEPVTNRRLAELMRCTPGEASKRVAQLHAQGRLRKLRQGREVLISHDTLH